MNLQLEGKRALITGSSRGIGEAIAGELAAEGAAVVVHGTRLETAAAVAEKLGEMGGEAVAVAGDLSTDAGADEVVEAALAHGHVDILVNNAGTFEACSWWEGSPQRWADVYDTNLVSMVRLIHGLVPRMKERGWGRVVQVASVSATLAPPIFPDYAAAKAATLSVTASLARVLAKTGITVNTVSPGPMATDTWGRFAMELGRRFGWEDDLEGVKTRLLTGIMQNPCDRIGEPEEVGAAVAFLASPRAGYINGVNLRVDGGLVGTIH